MKSIDTKLLGRKTYDLSLKMGATFNTNTKCYVFSREPVYSSAQPDVEFISEPISTFVARLRAQKGRNIWMMGGSELIASFIDAGLIDEFVISVIPTFIGEGIPLLARRHRKVPLQLRSVKTFPDGVFQIHYAVQTVE